jgi:hypothetical protein
MYTCNIPTYNIIIYTRIYTSLIHFSFHFITVLENCARNRNLLSQIYRLPTCLLKFTRLRRKIRTNYCLILVFMSPRVYTRCIWHITTHNSHNYIFNELRLRKNKISFKYTVNIVGNKYRYYCV